MAINDHERPLMAQGHGHIEWSQTAVVRPAQATRKHTLLRQKETCIESYYYEAHSTEQKRIDFPSQLGLE